MRMARPRGPVAVARAARAVAALTGVAVALALPAAAALAHKGNPNYRSNINRVEPDTPGLRFEVLNRDDRLLAVNRSSRDLLVSGYGGEPYVRIDGDGTVEINQRSPAHYLNQDRFAKVAVPSSAMDSARPRWQKVSGDGRYEWHDHRIHYMSKGTPPQVKDEGERAKVFDWRVPIEAGGRKGRIAGTLTWEPDDSNTPIGAFVALAVIAVVGAAAYGLGRRRRAPRRWRGGDAW